jgi:hypothetical protein
MNVLPAPWVAQGEAQAQAAENNERKIIAAHRMKQNPVVLKRQELKIGLCMQVTLKKVVK